MNRQMVQYNTSPASATPGALPLSRLEVFRKLGVTVITPSVPEPVKVEPEPVIEEPVEQVEEPTEATLEVASETTPVEENSVVEEEENGSTPISELQLKKTYTNVLIANGIETLEDLAKYIASGKDLSEISGIGAVTANSIIEKFESWQNEQNQTK